MTTTSDAAVTLHLRWLALRGLRPSSQLNRRCALGRLGRWAGGRPLLDLTVDDLLCWQDQRVTQLSPGARRGELSHAREFYRWAMLEGLRGDDPTLRLPMPRAPRRLPRPMSEASFAAALIGADPKVAAILALAGYAGLRCMEIAQLDWSEIDLTSTPPSVRVVNGKGGLGRSVFVSAALADVLGQLPEHRSPVIRRGDGNRGNCAAYRISQLGNRYLHSIGVPETVHQLRHRFATVAYSAERDIRAVQELLGHASPTTTSIYAAPGADARWLAVQTAGVRS